MIYDNSRVRRQDRLLDEGRAHELLERGEYGVLSVVAAGETLGQPAAYGIPVNFVWDGEDSLYVHCAPEGEKLRCIAANPEVSFCIVGRTNVLGSKFTTEYESVVLRCHARTGLSPEERMNALKLLLGKYSPDDMAIGMKYAEKSFYRTEVIRLDIRSVSGKSKRLG